MNKRTFIIIISLVASALCQSVYRRPKMPIDQREYSSLISVHLKPDSEVCVEGYTKGTTTFPEGVHFHGSRDIGKWTTTDHERSGEKLEYSLEAFDTGTRLHRKELEIYGVAGRNIPTNELVDPTVKNRCGKQPTVIPVGHRLHSWCRNAEECRHTSGIENKGSTWRRHQIESHKPR